MILHEDPDLFLELIQKTSDKLDIQETFIEKDYWVIYVLNTLVNWDSEKSVIFKGGTSLSKAFQIVERFSEDVDLVLKNTNLSQGQIKNKIKEVHKKSVIAPLEEIETEKNQKFSRIRRVYYKYPQTLEDYSEMGEAQDTLFVELNSFGNPFPIVEKQVMTYITEYLLEENLANIIDRFNLRPFDISVLDHKRTLCEKLMSLLRLSLKEDYLNELSRKTRHFYDIAKLMTLPEVKKYIQCEDFLKTLKEIYSNDLSIPQFNTWTISDLGANPLVVETETILNKIKPQFQGPFQNLLYRRETFNFEDINQSIQTLNNILKTIDFSKT